MVSTERRSTMDEIKDISPDEFADDDIVTLMNDQGEEIDFIEIAGIAHKGNFYAILQPVELLPGMEEDEAIVMEVTRDEEGNDKFSLVLDDEIIDAVFEQYNKLLDSVEGDDSDDE
jgi:hypothetical protein